MKNMKSVIIFLALILFTVICYLAGVYSELSAEQPITYRGQIVNRVQDSFVVQVVVPATEDELIGYEIGDEYLLQEVTE